MRWVVVFSVFVLVGCAVSEPAPPAVGLVPDAGGLQPNGSALRIDFGRHQTGVIAAVSRLKAEAALPLVEVPGCGVLLAWPDGLRLTFVGRNFRGWALGDQSAGVVCG